jgi:8-oxo-dGTP pyrophosphatase MutT (NUDIX family)
VTLAANLALPDTADWLAALRASASQLPLRPRVPLLTGSTVLGSVDAVFIEKIASQPSYLLDSLLLKTEHQSALAYCLTGEPTASLNALAVRMREVGLCGPWRDEQLAVSDPQGQRLGTVERGAVRPLGISTLAVHLVGFAPDGRVWVQQRALTKANDPGLWDTLMGGMVSAADTLQTALERETWEEAGLRLDQLRDLRHGGHITTQRPASDGEGSGYVVERIDWFVATVPDGVLPVNQDGEVACFELISEGEVWRRMLSDGFTLEAALILVSAFGA